MIRLDKYLADAGFGTRSEVKEKVRKGLVSINGTVIKNANLKLDEVHDTVTFQGKPIAHRGMVYYLLHKPAGVVSAVTDKRDRTVVELIQDVKKDDLFPVGRLDKDTEGLLIITNDGPLTHELLAPGKHVDKTYQVVLTGDLPADSVDLFRQGIDISEKKPCMGAELTILEAGAFDVPEHVLVPDNAVYAEVTIREGKFHQIKRMFHAIGMEVIYLRRIRMGDLVLDTSLLPGEYRCLSEKEIRMLQAGTKKKPAYITDAADAILFDMDGTLIDSMGMWGEIDVEYLGRFGLEVPEDLEECLAGKGFTETAVYFKERFSLPDSVDEICADWIRMASAFYRTKAELKPGVRTFIERMHEQGKKMAIATSNASDLARAWIDAAGFIDKIDALVTACEVKSKPHPDIYLEAARRVGVAPERCLVFEDIVMGVLAGKRAGMRVCAVEDTYAANQKEKIRELADYYIRDYHQVLNGSEEVL